MTTLSIATTTTTTIPTPSISVSSLIRNLNCLIDNNNYRHVLSYRNRKKNIQRISSKCICMFLLDRNTSPSTDDICIEHINLGSPLVNSILEYFKQKNIIFIDLVNYQKLLTDKKIKLLLPLIINVYIFNQIHPYFLNKTIPCKLDIPSFKYTNLLIINFINHDRLYHSYFNKFNKFLSKDKVINFNYGIFINYKDDKILQSYITKLSNNNNNMFSFKIGKFFHNFLINTN